MLSFLVGFNQLVGFLPGFFIESDNPLEQGRRKGFHLSWPFDQSLVLSFESKRRISGERGRRPIPIRVEAFLPKSQTECSGELPRDALRPRQ